MIRKLLSKLTLRPGKEAREREREERKKKVYDSTSDITVTTSKDLPKVADGVDPDAPRTATDLYVWKALRNERVAFLRIPKGSAVIAGGQSKKCRASQAEVLNIFNVHLPVGMVNQVKAGRSMYDESFVYEVGSTVAPTQRFDTMQLECSTGIHYFHSVEDALKWMVMNNPGLSMSHYSMHEKRRVVDALEKVEQQALRERVEI